MTSALLKLPQKLSRSRKEERVEQILEELVCPCRLEVVLPDIPLAAAVPKRLHPPHAVHLPGKSLQLTQSVLLHIPFSYEVKASLLLRRPRMNRSVHRGCET